MTKERKVWSEHEDKILKYLKQEKGQAKWSTIAKKMQEEFQIFGRTGKQCRQRYHNHLDSSIINTQWTLQEDEILYNLHQQFGNKWSSISQVIKGRSDNCVKNRFYSKLRKSARKLNKFIQQFFSKQYEPLSTRLISKILELNQQKFKTSTKVDQYVIQCSNNLKNKLYKLESQFEQNLQKQQDFIYIKQLLDEVTNFSKSIKKSTKSEKKRKKSFEYNQSFLHPKINMMRSSSFGSQQSDRSSESSIFLSSNCSLFDDDQEQLQGSGSAQAFIGKKSYTTRSSRNLVTSRNSAESYNHKSILEQPVNLKIKKALSHNSNRSQRNKMDLQKQGFVVFKQKMRDQSQQKLKRSCMQDEIKPFVSQKERYSPQSQKSSSHSQKNHKSFPRNIDEFNYIEQKLEMFHLNMNFEAQQQIIWRVFQPKQKNKMQEEEQMQIQAVQSEDID